MRTGKLKVPVKNSDRLNIIKAAKASGHKGGYLELFEEFRTNSKESEGHIEAETTREIRQGLEGAAYGTSANLNFEKSFNHMLEGRQDYAVKVQADGMYQGILSPDEEYFMVDTSSTVGEAPVLKYGGIAIKQGTDNTGIVETPDPTFLEKLTNPIRKQLAEHLYPVGYDGSRINEENEVERYGPLGKIYNALRGREDTSILRDRLENTMPPDKYKALIQEREDFLQLVMGQDQKHNTVNASKYRPSDSKDKNAVYYTSQVTEDLLKEFLSSEGGELNTVIDDKNPIKRSKPGSGIDSKDQDIPWMVKTRKDFTGKKVVNAEGTLGNFTIDRGTDEDGREYVSYYDKWDLDPFKVDNKSVNAIMDKVQSAVGVNSPEIYGRVYLDELKYGGEEKDSGKGVDTPKFKTGGISRAIKYQGDEGSNVVKEEGELRRGNGVTRRSKATIFIGGDGNDISMFDADFERMKADLDKKYGAGNYQVVRADDVQEEMNSKLYGSEGKVDYDPAEYEKALKRKNARSFELFKKNNPDYNTTPGWGGGEEGEAYTDWGDDSANNKHKFSSFEDLKKNKWAYRFYEDNYGYYTYEGDEEWAQANDAVYPLIEAKQAQYKQQALYKNLSSEEKLAAYKSYFESMGEGSDIYILKHNDNMFLSKAGTLSEGTRSDFKYGNTPDKIDTFTEALNAWGPGTTGTCYMGTCTGTGGAEHITNETGMTTKAQKGNWAGYYNRSGTYGDDQTFDEQFFNPQNKGNQQSGGYYNTYTKEGDNVNVESTGYNAPIQNAPRYQGDTSSGIVTDSVETAAAPVVDDTYSFTRDGYEVADTDLSGYDIELLYSAIQQHEHRGYFPDGKMAEGYDPFIRTKKKGSGSSAYGPGQLTEFIMSDITTPGIRQYYDVENMNTDFHKSLVDQSKLFLKYGGDDWKKFIDKETQLVDGMTQQEVQDLYEYGGAGTLGGSDDNRAEYKKLNKQIIEGKLRKTIEKGKEGDDVLKLMLKQYGTGSNSYVTGVEKIYNKLLKEKKNKNKKKEKKTIDPFPNIKDPLLRQQLMRNMDKA